MGLPRGLTRSLFLRYVTFVDSDSSENETETIGERAIPYVFGFAVGAILIGVKKTLLWLGVSGDVMRVAEIGATILFVGFFGWLLVTMWLTRRQTTEKKRIQALLEQKTTALLSALPESKEALSLAAEVDAIHMFNEQKSGLSHYAVTSEAECHELTERLGRYWDGFSSPFAHKQHAAQTCRALRLPRNVCASLDSLDPERLLHRRLWAWNPSEEQRSNAATYGLRIGGFGGLLPTKADLDRVLADAQKEKPSSDESKVLRSY